jgi:hypothetical protein
MAHLSRSSFTGIGLLLGHAADGLQHRGDIYLARERIYLKVQATIPALLLTSYCPSEGHTKSRSELFLTITCSGQISGILRLRSLSVLHKHSRTDHRKSPSILYVASIQELNSGRTAPSSKRPATAPSVARTSKTFTQDSSTSRPS